MPHSREWSGPKHQQCHGWERLYRLLQQSTGNTSCSDHAGYSVGDQRKSGSEYILKAELTTALWLEQLEGWSWHHLKWGRWWIKQVVGYAGPTVCRVGVGEVQNWSLDMLSSGSRGNSEEDAEQGTQETGWSSREKCGNGHHIPGEAGWHTNSADERWKRAKAWTAGPRTL